MRLTDNPKLTKPNADFCAAGTSGFRESVGMANGDNGPGGDLVASIVNSDCSFEMVMPKLPCDQDIPRAQLIVVALAMTDHFPRIDDPCIRPRKKAELNRR